MLNSSVTNGRNNLRNRHKHKIKNINNRNTLFGDSANAVKSVQSKNATSTAAEDAKTIHDSLLRSKALLSQELDRVNTLNQTIDNDNKILMETNSSHLFLGNIVTGAKSALRQLKSQENRDMVLLWSSVMFFYSIVLYIVWTRIRIPFILW